MERLEAALATATSDPAARPEFYRILLESEIYVPGSSNTPVGDSHLLPAGASLALAKWKKTDGTEFIPFFASVRTLELALKEPTRYVAMPARALFEMTRGTSLIINPTSENAKEFLPNEIEALLETGVNCTPTVEQVQEPRKIRLGQPSVCPVMMVNSLAKMLAMHAGVKAAYLCLMDDPTSGEKPALVVGLEGEGDLVSVIHQAGSVAADTAPVGQPVKFLEIKRGERGIAEYLFASASPFYKRDREAGWRAWLRSRPGVGFGAIAVILGVGRRALMPNLPGFIAWPLIFCILIAYVWLVNGGRRPVPPAEQ